MLNYPPPRRPPPHHHHFHFRKEIVKKTPALQGLGGGGRLVLIVAASLEGWKAGTFSPPLSGLDLGALRGEVEDRREARSFGVFFFSRTLARAHTASPLVWRLRTRGGEAPSPQVAEAWRLGEDLPREAVPRKFSEAEATVQPGPPPRRIPGHSLFTLACSASTRPGAAHGPRSRLSPRSSTVGATLSSPGPESGGGDAGGPLRREER